ncbi:MAG: HEPN domain-containing protein [Candidatus Coatesbacteria bacterium]|nr:HEPN domain-containing protein [Candidatus Coatesbacteria bacterium]
MLKDIENTVRLWREEAVEDMDLARDILARNKYRHAMFFAHLALEKALKALVMRATEKLAPRIHNLVELANKAGLSMDEESMKILAVMNFYQMAGRYLEARRDRVDPQRATENFRRSERIFEWLIGL